jgi:hypothetical protein
VLQDPQEAWLEGGRRRGAPAAPAHPTHPPTPAYCMHYLVLTGHCQLHSHWVVAAVGWGWMGVMYAAAQLPLALV